MHSPRRSLTRWTLDVDSRSLASPRHTMASSRPTISSTSRCPRRERRQRLQYRPMDRSCTRASTGSRGRRDRGRGPARRVLGRRHSRRRIASLGGRAVGSARASVDDDRGDHLSSLAARTARRARRPREPRARASATSRVVDGIPVTTVERTIFDLAAVCSRFTVDLAIDNALRRDLTTVDELVADAASCRQARAARARGCSAGCSQTVTPSYMPDRERTGADAAPRPP